MSESFNAFQQDWKGIKRQQREEITELNGADFLKALRKFKVYALLPRSGGSMEVMVLIPILKTELTRLARKYKINWRIEEGGKHGPYMLIR